MRNKGIKLCSNFSGTEVKNRSSFIDKRTPENCKNSQVRIYNHFFTTFEVVILLDEIIDKSEF